MNKNLCRCLACALALWLLTGCGKAPEPAPSSALAATREASAVPETSGETTTQTEPAAQSSPTTEPAKEAMTEPMTDPTTEPDPTDAPDPLAERLAAMTLEGKVAQLFVVTPEALTGATNYITAADESLREAYAQLPVGGVLLMGGNLKDPAQTKALCADLQVMSREALDLSLFLCVDEEGGVVARVSGNPAFGLDPVPSMAEVGASGDVERARQLGAQVGGSLRELGFNVDFAPDADVLTNPENQVVRSRSFGSDPVLVTEMARAFSDGLLEQGVLPCWKHFPGHGGTAEDTHKGFASLPYTMEELLDSDELKPFLYAASSGIPIIMTGHIAVPAATGDELPASLSEQLVSLLRCETGNYPGLLITDGLAMKAITQRYTPGEAAVLALRAGNDLLLVSEHLQEAYDAVLEAVRKGELPEARIDESVLRILRIKATLETASAATP